jgi:hypothetical protein
LDVVLTETTISLSSKYSEVEFTFVVGDNIKFIWLILSVALGLFILGRELLCWYWKVNKIVKNQDQIIVNQNETNGYLKRIIELEEKLIQIEKEKEQ